MLTHEELELMWNIEIACRRCIRGARYCEAVAGSQQNRWAFAQNCFAGISIVLWCQVFGSRSEPTHYSKIFLSSAQLPFSQSDVAARLRAAVNMTEEDYNQFWQGVKDVRDEFFVHNEFVAGRARPVFPDTDHMAAVCLEMRIILREMMDDCQSEDPEFQEHLRRFISHYTNETFLSEIDRDLPHMKQASEEH